MLFDKELPQHILAFLCSVDHWPESTVLLVNPAELIPGSVDESVHMGFDLVDRD
jgi:hypothetical protein